MVPAHTTHDHIDRRALRSEQRCGVMQQCCSPADWLEYAESLPLGWHSNVRKLAARESSGHSCSTGENHDRAAQTDCCRQAMGAIASNHQEGEMEGRARMRSNLQCKVDVGCQSETAAEDVGCPMMSPAQVAALKRLPTGWEEVRGWAELDWTWVGLGHHETAGTWCLPVQAGKQAGRRARRQAGRQAGVRR
jgi:hypothetical protein